MNIFNRDSKYCVVGYGSWGTAIAKILLESGNEIGWFISNDDVRNGLINDRVNHKYLTDVHFPPDKNITFYDSINSAVKNSDILIFAVPSAFLIDMLKPLTESFDNKMVISAIKGIVTNSKGDYVTITEYFNDVYGVKYDNLGVLTGPCHAEEIAYERLTYINVICKNLILAESISERFNCKYVYASALTDIYGAEYAAVMKNIYAIAVGICKGLNYGDNFIAVLISNCQCEMKYYLTSTFHFQRELTRSPYMGDLLVTAYSQFSRNRRFGMIVGQGHSIQSARIELNDMIAEGYYATKCIYDIVKSKDIQLPIVEAVYKILYERNTASSIIKELARKLK